MYKSVKELSDTSIDTHIPVGTVLSGTGIAMFGILGGRIIEFFTRLIAARFLGVEQFGVFILAVTLFQFSGSLVLMGIPAGITRYISFAKGRGLGSREHIARIIITGLRLSLPLAFIASLGYWAGRIWIANNIFNAPDLALPLSFMAVAIPFFILTEFFSALLRGIKAISKFVLCHDIISRSLRLVLFLIFTIVGFSLFRASLAYLVGFVISALVAIFFSRKFLPKNLNLIWRIPFFKDILVFSWPLVVSALIMQAGGYVTGNLILGLFCNPTAVGLYSVAFAVASLISLILVGVRTVFMPVFTELYAAQKTVEMKRMYTNVSRWIFYIALPATILIYLYSQHVLSFFGRGYIDAVIPLLILSSGFLFSCMAGPTGQILLALGESKTVLLLNIFYIAVNLSLCILLVPRFGATGAALATACAIFIWNGVSLMFVFRRLYIQPFTLLHGSFSLFMLIITGAIIISQKVLSLNTNLALFTGVVGIGLAVVAFISFFSPHQDRVIIKTILQKILQREEVCYDESNGNWIG